MYRYIEPFFVPLVANSEPEPAAGQFWWTCYPYLPDRPALKGVHYVGNKLETDSISVKEWGKHEDPRERPGCKPDEFVALVRFKRRPVVVLSRKANFYRDRSWRGGDWWVVAPLLTLRYPETNEYKSGFEFVCKAIKYQYRGIFYLPEGNSYGIKESIVHLDQMTVMHRSWLTEPRSGRLAPDALRCLDLWLGNYLRGVAPRSFGHEIAAYRELVDEVASITTDLWGT